MAQRWNQKYIAMKDDDILTGNKFDGNKGTGNLQKEVPSNTIIKSKNEGKNNGKDSTKK